jgi:hypothetical protein
MYKIHRSTLYKGKLYFRCNGNCMCVYIYKNLGKLKLTFFGLLKHLARCCCQYKQYDMMNQLG